MEVIIRPDLHVIVLLNHSLRVGVTGRFSFHTVCWDECASEEFPAASPAMLAADVCDCIALFQSGEIAACDWTDILAGVAILFDIDLEADRASSDARNDPSVPGPTHNGPKDAYRHCLWQCRVSSTYGDAIAKAAGDFHEAGSGNPADEERMDQNNNICGRQAPGKNCDTECKSMLADGWLTTLENPDHEGPQLWGM